MRFYSLTPHLSAHLPHLSAPRMMCCDHLNPPATLMALSSPALGAQTHPRCLLCQGIFHNRKRDEKMTNTSSMPRATLRPRHQPAAEEVDRGTSGYGRAVTTSFQTSHGPGSLRRCPIGQKASTAPNQYLFHSGWR